MSSKPGTISLALVLGFASTTVQVLAIRELLVAFTGNELTIATTLAVWLLAVGAGSLLSIKLAARGRSFVPGLLIVAGLVSLVQVISIRLVAPLATGAGEIAGPAAVAALSAVGILPGATIFGALFGILVAEAAATGFHRPIAAIYGAEALGSAAAGLALSAYLLEAVNPVAVTALAAALALAGGSLALKPRARSRGLGPPILAACVIALAAVIWQSGSIDLGTRRAQWRPLDVVRSVESRYGNIVVTRLDGSFQFFESGALASTVPDPRYAEESSHLPLLHHPGPHNVLVLGGAGSGIVREVLKHPSVRRVDFVELDPAALSLVKTYAPQGWLDGTARASVNSYYGDGREYVAKAMSMYDVLLVGAGMPTSLEVNRYYTREFFKAAERLLERDGILAVKMASPGASPGPETAGLAASIANALRASFPSVVTLPGDYIHILASPGLDLKAETPLVAERLARRGIETSFVNQFVLWDRLSALRLAQLDSTVASHNQGQVNSDDRPVAFALAISLWEKQMAAGHALSRLVSWLDPVKCVLALAGLGLAVAAISVAVPRLPIRAFPSLLVLYSVGLATMFTQVLVILAFQIASGYVYGRIAAVVAAYMVGMGLVATRMAARAGAAPRPGRHRTGVLYATLMVPPLVVPAALRLLGGDPRSVPGWAADVVFVGVAGLTGCVGGAVFSAAAQALAAHTKAPARAAALAYSVDLAGASVAGFITGLVVIPALGILRSACAVSAATLAALVLAAIAARLASASQPR